MSQRAAQQGWSYTRSGVGVPLKLDTYPADFRAKTEAAVDAVLAAAADPIIEPAPRPAPLESEVTLPGTAPSLLGICGLPHAGKDVIADLLQARYRGVRRMAFSDAIIADVNLWLAAHGRRICAETKSLAHNRQLLQQWGLARRLDDELYTVTSMRARVQAERQAGAQLIIVTGARCAIDPSTRRVNTLDMQLISQLGGEVWKAERPGNPYRASNPVEDGLFYVPDNCFDAVVLNDREGDLESYHRNVEQTLHLQRRRREIDVADLELVAEDYPLGR